MIASLNHPLNHVDPCAKEKPKDPFERLLSLEGALGDAFRMASISASLIEDLLCLQRAEKVGGFTRHTFTGDEIENALFGVYQTQIFVRSLREQFYAATEAGR